MRWRYDDSVTRVAFLAPAVCAGLMVAGSASGGSTVGADRVLRFGDLPRGWVKGIPRDVRPNSRIVGILGGHRVATGPTRNGNYCVAIRLGRRSGIGGCVVRDARWSGTEGEIKPYLINPLGSVDKRGVIALGGSASARPGTHLYFVYADGAQERVQLTFVSRPIAAAFFYRTIPQAHRTLSTRLRWVELREGSKVVARQRASTAPGFR